MSRLSMRMLPLRNSKLYFVFKILFSFEFVYSLAVNIGDVKQISALKVEPNEAIVFPGENVTFTCFHQSNSSFTWDFTSMIKNYHVVDGSFYSSGKINFYSSLTIYSTTRLMSGEITCSIDEGNSKTAAFLIINGVRTGGSCQTASDCITDRAICLDGVCECPSGHVHLRIKDRSYDICREMIYSLYDPCEYDEQCIHLVDPRSVCKSVCVCAAWARDRKGRCVSISELAYNRSQEMYRVGLIAVTCIIILIVAVSLWVTLKRSCHDQNIDGQRQSITQVDFHFPNDSAHDFQSDKPPSYDDILDKQEDTITNPPNFRDALEHCMTAKRLIRQVSAPAGQMLQEPMIHKTKSEKKPFNDS